MQSLALSFLLGWFGGITPLPPPEGALLTLREGPCFGRCPAFSVTIYEDGRVDYEGEAHVRVAGHKHSKIALREVAKLAAALHRAKFDELAEKYECHCTDSQAQSLCTRDPLHCVTFESPGLSGAPNELQDLIAEVVQITGASRWVNSDPTDKQTDERFLTEEEVRRVVDRGAAAIHRCLSALLAKRRPLDGHEDGYFDVDWEGKVSHGQISSTNIHDSEADDCIESVIKSWRFHAPAQNFIAGRFTIDVVARQVAVKLTRCGGCKTKDTTCDLVTAKCRLPPAPHRPRSR